MSQGPSSIKGMKGKEKTFFKIVNEGICGETKVFFKVFSVTQVNFKAINSLIYDLCLRVRK